MTAPRTPTELEPVPAWVIDGWYANNPGSQKLAMVRWRLPVTTPAERAMIAARSTANDVETLTTYPCAGCGQFAFAHPKLCFWCRRR